MSAQFRKPSGPGAASSVATGIVAAGLADLQRAVKAAEFYPQGHPYRTESLQRSFETFGKLLALRPLVFTVNRRGFLLGGERVDGNELVLKIAHDCAVRRITSITLLQDLLLYDLDALVRLLASEPSGQGLEGDARTIWLNDRDVAAILARRAEADQGAVRAAATRAATADNAGPGRMTGSAEAGEGRGLGREASPSVGQRGRQGEEPTGPAGERAASVREQGASAGEQGASVRERTAANPAQASPTAVKESRVPELLRAMAQEPVDARYQELGSELLARVRGGQEEESILPALEELLRQHREPQRSLPQKEFAVFTFGQLADASADFLLRSLENKGFRAKERIHRVLEPLGARAAYWVIERIGNANGLYERRCLAAALVALGAVAIAPLLAMLKDNRWYVVRNMVSVIGELGATECVAELMGPLHHKDDRVRKEAIRALAKIGGEQAEALLATLLEETDEVLVRRAISSLGQLRSRQAVPAMLKLLERRDLFMKDLAVKKEVLAALSAIGDRSATGSLLKLLESRGWTAPAKWLELKIAVVSTLGVIGDEAALPTLARLAAGDGPLADTCRDALEVAERGNEWMDL